jgi:excisionase family DNA binding protein
MNEDRATLTVEEAASLLGISRNSAYRAVRDGDLPAVRIRRRLLIPVAHLHALLRGDESPSSHYVEQ